MTSKMIEIFRKDGRVDRIVVTTGGTVKEAKAKADQIKREAGSGG
jgi:hypothetical protein